MGMLVIGSIIRPRIFISTSTGSSSLDGTLLQNIFFWSLFSRRVYGLQEFLHVLTGRIGDSRTAHHPDEFFDTSLACERVYASDGASFMYAFFDPELMVGERRNLRQMSHTKNLISH